MKKQFTLIELIIVIAVLGILSSIIIPNISDIKPKGYKAAIGANIHNLQTANDTFTIEDGQGLIGIAEPTLLLPQSIDFSKVYPKFIKNLPKTPTAKYWVDAFGSVWGAQVDAPTGFLNDEGKVTWSHANDTKEFQVYELEGYKSTGAINTKNLRLRQIKAQIETLETHGGITNYQYIGEAGKTYLVSAIDKDGFSTAPVGTGQYTEYQDTLESTKKGESGDSVQANRIPLAVISMEPEQNLTTDTTITWGYQNSSDPDGDEIINAQWRGKKDKYDQPGLYLVELRVQDSKGNWSQWASVPFTVTDANHKPTAVIRVNPSSGITDKTITTWDHLSSTDPDGDAIVAAEWQVDGGSITSTPPNGKFTSGSHTINLRVKDSRNAWSDWVSQSITIDHENYKPTAVISYTPNTGIMTNTTITWSYANSTDPDGDQIVDAEWSNMQNMYTTAGTQHVGLRVKDSDGNWSDWVYTDVVVTRLNNKPNAVIVMNPTAATYINPNNSIWFNSTGSADPDGDTINAYEWIVDNGAPTSTINLSSKKYALGDHTVSLRVRDSQGLWSDPVTKTFTVTTNTAPWITSITWSPGTPTSNDWLYFNYTWDDKEKAAGDTVGAYDYEFYVDNVDTAFNMGSKYTNGTHQLKARIKDSGGLWSDWFYSSVTVGAGGGTGPITTYADGQPSSSSAYYCYFTQGGTQYGKYTFQVPKWNDTWDTMYNYNVSFGGHSVTYNKNNGANQEGASWGGNFYMYNVPSSYGTNMTFQIISKASGAVLYTYSLSFYQNWTGGC